MNQIIFNSIGIIRTPHKYETGMPIQPRGAIGLKGYIEIFKEFQDGLLHLEEYSHVYLIYYLHKCKGYKLQAVPFMDDEIHGIFATRSPKRPNPIGLSIVKILDIKNNIINIENVDMLDKTPLLDIKPYVPKMDNFETEKNGWLDKNHIKAKYLKADDRFLKKT
jgi:tRNA-Thr(GGU) m(6)t(6)A37 methyltransferase TsaA